MAAELRPSALLLAPEAPYPPMGGGALRTASLLHHLAQGYDVDLILFRQPGAPDPADALPRGLVRRADVLELPHHSRGTAARTWRNARRLARGVPPLLDRFSGFGEEVNRLLDGRRYDVGLIEHFWCAPYAQQAAPRCARLLLDLHNVESTLHTRCAGAAGGPEAIAHRVFARVCRRLERTWLERYTGLLVTSEADAERVAALAPGVRVTVYPNAIPAVPLPVRHEENVVVFSGNMEYHPNVAAVRFFRRRIWPLLRERCPGVVWRLVGKNPAAVERYTRGDPSIEVTGEVPDAIAELARAKVAVVPLLSGSGTRFKILEAWAAATPVVSTRIGAEGLPVRAKENILLEDSAEEFAAATAALMASPDLRARLGTAGRRLLEQQFTWQAAWKRLDF